MFSPPPPPSLYYGYLACDIDYDGANSGKRCILYSTK